MKENIGIGGVEELEAPIRAELLGHAQRMARLERVSDLAAEASNEAAVTRIQAAITLEDDRHERQLLQLTAVQNVGVTVEVTP